MKATVNQKDLLKIINIAQKATSQRTTMPILEGILFEFSKDVLTLKSTNLNNSIITEMSIKADEEFSFVLNANIISNIIRKLPDTEIEFEKKGNLIEINYLNSKMNLSYQESSEYPDVEILKTETAFSIDAHLMKESIRQTQFAAAKNDAKQILNGILMELKDDFINFVALDGYRIAVKKIPYEIRENIKAVVHADTFNLLNSIIDEDDLIEINIGETEISFKLNNTILTGRLIEGNFINYKDIIKNAATTVVKLNREEFLECIERASLMAKEQNTNLIKIKIEDDYMHISSNSEIGNIHEVLSIEKFKENLIIAFNGSYLSDVLKVLNVDRISMDFESETSPCIIKPEDDNLNFTYMLLPVKLSSY